MPATRRIQVRFFAILREQAGVSALECETQAHTPAELYQELAGARGLTVPAALLRVAINDRYATLEAPLRPDDRVVFLPPVAGG